MATVDGIAGAFNTAWHARDLATALAMISEGCAFKSTWRAPGASRYFDPEG